MDEQPIEAPEPVASQEPEIEYSIDLDNLPTVKHKWISRGAKMSCEGADHPHHSHFLVRR